MGGNQKRAGCLISLVIMAETNRAYPITIPLYGR